MGRQWATWDPDTFLMWSSQILKLRIFHIKKYLETSVFLEKLEFFRTGVAIIRYSPAGAPPVLVCPFQKPQFIAPFSHVFSIWDAPLLHLTCQILAHIGNEDIGYF